MKNKFSVFLCIALITACSKPPAEEAVRSNIEAVQKALEEKDTSDVLSYVKSDFLGNGYLEKSEIRRMLIAQFLQHQNINVVFSSLDVEHREELPYQTRMSGLVGVTGAENLLPNDGRLLSVSGTWRLVDDEWLLETLEWE